MHYRTISLARNPFYRSFGIGFLSKNLLRKSQTVWLQFPLQIIVRIMNKLIIQFEANFRTFLTNQSGVGGTSPWNNVGKSFFFLSLPPHLRQTEHNDVWRWWGTKRLWPLSQRPKKDEIWRLTFSTTTTTKKIIECQQETLLAFAKKEAAESYYSSGRKEFQTLQSLDQLCWLKYTNESPVSRQVSFF